MNATREKYFDLILNVIAHETRRSGLSREYCEKLMFDSISARSFSEEEKAYYAELLKVVLDRAFPACSLPSARSLENSKPNGEGQMDK